MTKEICPGCGAPYNGKKCRACNFEPFGADKVRRPRLRRSTFPKTRKKQRSPIGSMIGFLIILLLIAVMLPVLRDWGLELEAAEVSGMTPEPLPEDPMAVHREIPESNDALPQETDTLPPDLK